MSRTRYFAPGGEVDIKTPIGTEYLLHLDQIFVRTGQVVSPSTVLGVSGGQLAGGSHPASPAYSSGPHTELGFFTGSPWLSRSLDPAQVLGGLATMPPAPPDGTSATLGLVTGVQSPDDAWTLWPGISIPGLGNLGQVQLPKDIAWRGGLIFVGVVMVFIGLVITFKPGVAAAAGVASTVAAPETALTRSRAASTAAGERTPDTAVKDFPKTGRSKAA